MRIVQTVTLVGDSGAYGGPVSVATGQLNALRGRGHDVLLVSMWDGDGVPPAAMDGIPLDAATARTLIPGTGFSGLFALSLLAKLWRAVGQADVVHVHTARDLASLSALLIARLRRKPVVVQTHGMMQVRRSPVARVFDLLMSPLLARAHTCLVLTAEERKDLQDGLGHRVPLLTDLPNGVAVSLELRSSAAARLGYAPRVVYVARLHPRKRPTAFVQAAAIVHSLVPDATFELYGPDEGALAEVEREIAAAGLQYAVAYHGAVDHQNAVQIIANADVYVLPSVNEPFPMSLLEALGSGTPVVCTDSTGISDQLRERTAAVVTDGSPEQLAEGILSLLTDPVQRDAQITAGILAVTQEFSIDAVAAKLEKIYTEAVRLGAPHKPRGAGRRI